MTDENLRQRAIALYDRFTHEHHDRRAFMAELTKLAGSAAAANLLLAGIAADPAAAVIVQPGDQRIRQKQVDWPTVDGRTMRGYLAMPARADTDARVRLPSVIIIHENRGLTDYIRDVARRAAVAGFLALAPDFLSPDHGRTPPDEDRARDIIQRLNLTRVTEDAARTLRWLSQYRQSDGNVGAVGFCWGGALVNRLAIAAGADLKAGVAFYGPTPDPAEAPKVKAAMLLHYAALDDRVNAGAGPWVTALQAAGVAVTSYTYPGVNHAFHNDTSTARYDAQAAQLAWDRTVGFLKEHVR